MTLRTIFASVFSLAALLVASVVGSYAVGEFSGRLLALILVATSSTFLLAYWAASLSLSSIGWRLIFGAAIPVLSLLFVCALQYFLASDCNPATRYDGDSASSKACFDREVASIGFAFASPVFAFLGATIAVIAAKLAKRLPSD